MWFTLDVVGSVLNEGNAVRHRTMAEAALDRLREAIILGELTPGTPLRLEDLASSLGMSISPMREAVRRLEALGLAEHVPHHGAKVTGLDVEELRELFAVRLALETMAVRRAAERFDAPRTRQPRADSSRRPTRRGTTATYAKRDARAHRLPFRALRGGAVRLARSGLIRPAWDSCERYRPVLLAEKGDLQSRHAALDTDLLEACVAHDPDKAGEALREHLELATAIFSVELAGRSIFAF